MSASLDKNVAIIDGVTQMTQDPTWSNGSIVKAIAPEQIPPHTINKIKIGVKAVNVWIQVCGCEDLGLRGLMIAGGVMTVHRDEDEVFELEIPVMNLTNENVNVSVGDEIAEIYLSETDNIFELSQADWDVYNGGGVFETLTITVTDGTDPIAGASVSIDWGEAVTTDENGEAELSNITANTHHVFINKAWYDNFDDDVAVDDEEIELHLAVHENDGDR